MDSNVAHRVRNLTDSITFQVFQYTTRWRFLNRGCFKKNLPPLRGLFECDKLIFTAQMAFQILLMNKEINPLELDFLLRFPTTSNTTSPVDFITNSGWGSLKSLSGMEEFRNLDRDIENNAKR